MDPTQALKLARQLIPATGLAHAQAGSAGLTPEQARTVDRQPQDNRLTQEEVYQALVENRLEAYGQATQEQIFNSRYGNFSNAAATNLGFGLQSNY